MSKLNLSIEAFPGTEGSPFRKEQRGKYFLYWFGQALSGLSDSRDDFAYGKIISTGQSMPNCAVYERVALMENGEFHEFCQPEFPAGEYLIFDGVHAIEAFTSYPEALQHMHNHDSLNPLLLARQVFIPIDFPDTFSPHPFQHSTFQYFFYLTNRKFKFSRCRPGSGFQISELYDAFPMGYTNLWQMKRLVLFHEKSKFQYENPGKNELYLMTPAGIVETPESLEQGLELGESYAKSYPAVILADRIEDLMWH